MSALKEFYKDFWQCWKGILAVNMELFLELLRAKKRISKKGFACGNTDMR